MSILKELMKSGNGQMETPEELKGVKWGIAQPVPVRLSRGAGQYRAFGTYTLKIADEKVYRSQLAGLTDGRELEEIRGKLASTISIIFSDSLAVIARSLTGEELLEKQREVEKAMIDPFRREAGALGLDVEELTVVTITGK